jgi:LmeA-like phospholipid-binding
LFVVRGAPGLAARQERASSAVRGCITKLVIPLVLVGLFSYLVLPGLVEDQIARRLQASVGTPTKPEVRVSSNFPPEMLLGRIDRVRVSADQMSLQGVAFYDARADLRGVSVSLSSLLEGSPRIEARSCYLGAAAPPVQIDDNRTCLGYLGLAPI